MHCAIILYVLGPLIVGRSLELGTTSKSYEAFYGSRNTSYAYRSPRDHDGHGTHTSLIVAGRSVSDASALGGFASGTVSGVHLLLDWQCIKYVGQPLVRNQTLKTRAIDDAIRDGVNVLNISIGTGPLPFSKDGIAVGALHAAKKEIVVVCGAGNDGPNPATVTNLAPWMITVGASSIDRMFPIEIRLGNGMKITLI